MARVQQPTVSYRRCPQVKLNYTDFSGTAGAYQLPDILKEMHPETMGNMKLSIKFRTPGVYNISLQYTVRYQASVCCVIFPLHLYRFQLNKQR